VSANDYTGTSQAALTLFQMGFVINVGKLCTNLHKECVKSGLSKKYRPATTDHTTAYLNTDLPRSTEMQAYMACPDSKPHYELE